MDSEIKEDNVESDEKLDENSKKPNYKRIPEMDEEELKEFIRDINR